MKRLHLFEFNDSPYCPRFVRDTVVEALGDSLRRGRIYERAADVFQDFCSYSGCRTILDLCSGSGEPVSIIIDALEEKELAVPEFILSDLFPKKEAMLHIASRHPGRIRVIQEPVDATRVPEKISHDGRTFFSSFHHFRPSDALMILKDCIQKKKAVFIMEPFTRDFLTFVPIFKLGKESYMANPFKTKQDRVLKFLFTFLLPILPVMGIWDGLVSVLRTYTERELTDLALEASTNYYWEYRGIPFSDNGLISVFWGAPQKVNQRLRLNP